VGTPSAGNCRTGKGSAPTSGGLIREAIAAKDLSVVDAGKKSILGLEGVAGFHIIAIKSEEKVPEIVEGAVSIRDRS
jgi:hypothetical protein